MINTLPPRHCADCPVFKKSAFASLSNEALTYLSKVKRAVAVERHQTFNVRGEPADTAYCLCSGNAKVVLSAGSSKESVLRIASPGEMVGYRCLFSESKYRATTVTLDSTTACRISREDFMELLEMETDFAREILRRMGQHLSEAEARHHSFVQRNVRERVAESLVSLQKTCGVRDELGWRLDIRLTRQELSAWVGAAKETVVRCLSDFREEGLIADTDGNEESLLTILNLDGLQKAAALTASP